MNIKKVTIAIIITIIISIFYQYGRSIWYPFYVKLRGKRSVKEVILKYESNVLKRVTKLREKKNPYPEKLVLIVIKELRRIEVWGIYDNKYSLIKKYKLTAFSGKLGPKLKNGDRQIPEGIYNVEYLNPNSSYHLSIKIDYPNRFDREMAKKDKRKNLGGDIMIHGKRATIGCIPIGDSNIEELFVIVAKVGIKNTQVIISPRDFRLNIDFPEIKKIDWEAKLYNRIKIEMVKYHK